MKWIGQHIWDFISRFRTTVYLENLETSSETNVLVVDSDGKVTKNSSASGDITGVTITTDSGGGSAASDTSGSADFSILGATGVGVTNSGTTITATAVPAEIDHDSLSNFVAAEHYRWDTDIASTATIHTENITDLHGAGVDGSAGELLSDDGDGTVTNNTNLVVSNTATSGAILDITADALTTGSAILIDDDSYERAGGHINIDVEDTLTTTIDRGGYGLLNINCNRPGGSPVASGQSLVAIAASIQMTDASTNVGTYTKTGLNIDISSTSLNGTVDNVGIVTDVGGGDTNYDIKMINPADDSEFATIEAGEGGMLNIRTVSDDSTGHLTILPDGDVNIESSIQKINKIYNFNTTAFENHYDPDVGSGTILKYSPGADDTLTGSALFFLHTDGTWDIADADDVATGASQLLGVGLDAAARTTGVLLKGFIRIANTEILNVPGSGAVDGLPVYVSTTAGHFDFTAPSGSSDFVRIVGYAIDDHLSSVLIYFDPDKTWVEIA